MVQRVRFVMEPDGLAVVERLDAVEKRLAPDRVCEAEDGVVRDGCPYDVAHTHKTGGGIQFDAFADLEGMILRRRSVISLEDMAELMET
jgi:hypothetical protein